MQGPEDILLATLNASYHHTAFGLRYIYANQGELQSRTKVLEFTTAQNPAAIAELIFAANPKILGLGVYIWNTAETRELVSILKRVKPELVIVLGGPEVSYETEGQALTTMADYVVQGEADFLFGELCQKILAGTPPEKKIISGPLPELTLLKLPYRFYSENDVAQRVVYVEASRGCPYKCEYCLSSLDKSVRAFPLDEFLSEMAVLLERGVRQFKFVDRTFNLSVPTSSRILEFFLQHTEKGIFLHFEMVPDRLPEELRTLIKKFPAGSLQFEVGIQSLDPQVAVLVSRRQNVVKIRENFSFLRNETRVHTHADLIAGLPGETLESFGRGFDELFAMGPDEIQVGILKRLKGTPIIRHDQEWAMVYAEDPPFVVLSTKTMDFATLQTMQRFSKFWDLYANSGNFPRSMDMVFSGQASRFESFHAFVLFLAARHAQSFGISLDRLAESLWLYAQTLGHIREKISEAVVEDICNGPAKRPLPRFLYQEKIVRPGKQEIRQLMQATPKRQQKHLAGRATT